MTSSATPTTASPFGLSDDQREILEQVDRFARVELHPLQQGLVQVRRHVAVREPVSWNGQVRNHDVICPKAERHVAQSINGAQKQTATRQQG